MVRSGARSLARQVAIPSSTVPWLYLNSLDSIERLRALVEFYVEQHNTQMPPAAFSGQTPDERPHLVGDWPACFPEGVGLR